MTLPSEQLFQEAMALPTNQRMELAERLLSSIGSSDQIDKLWAIEAEDRIDAYEKGKLKAVSAEDVFRKIDRFKNHEN
jgi:putative addiction module component (TIGR02574 family)